MKYKKVFISNKWQSEDILNKKKENIVNLYTFQEKFIILCNIMAIRYEKIEKTKHSKSFFGYKTKENQ